MRQDFSKKIVIVVRKDMEGWQIANSIAHISAYVGNKLWNAFGTGENFTTKDGAIYPRNSQYPIIVKRANSNAQLKNLLEKMRRSGLMHHAFVREMIDFADDSKLQESLGTKKDADVELLGVGVFGGNDEVAALTKKFGLWE